MFEGLGNLLSFDNLNGPLAFGYDALNTERNFYWQRRNWHYQKDLQQQIFNREDTAVQRRAADLKAAGFNPLLAAGGAASTGAAVSTTSPNIKSDALGMLLASRRAAADISMTKTQQELINEQAGVAKKNAELLDMQIQWYKDHPEFAPGISDHRATQGLVTDFLNSSNRFPAQRYTPNKDKIVSYHMKQGLSRAQAEQRAARQMKWQELERKGYSGAYKVRNVLNYN